MLKLNHTVQGSATVGRTMRKPDKPMVKMSAAAVDTSSRPSKGCTLSITMLNTTLDQNQ